MSDTAVPTGSERRRPPYRIAIADDDRNVLNALERLFGDHPLVEVTGAFGDGFEMRDYCRRGKPDAALIDVAMPGGGPDLARDLRVISPRILVVAHTAYGDSRTRTAMLAAGADAVVAKGSSVDIIAEVLELLERA